MTFSTGNPKPDVERKITIEDVAQHAGVSVGTVSNTLNHPDRVIAPTRDSVWASISELGYIPSQAARLLSGAPSRTLGLVVPDIESPFFMSLANAVEQSASDAGYSLLLCSSRQDASREPAILDVLSSHQVRGVLVSPASDTSPTAGSTLVPIVYLDHKGPDGTCSISVDHVLGGRLAAEHLLSLGHKNLAFVGGTPWLWQFNQRVKGIREAILEANLDSNKNLLLVKSPGIGVDSGMESARKLIEQGLPTGILCANDMLAFGIFKGLTAQNIIIPDDVSLVGYDDIRFSDSWIKPLTTVAQPTRLMGKLAGKLLIEHASEGVNHEHRFVALEPTLIVRESTRKAKLE